MEPHSDLPSVVTQPDVQISDVAVEHTPAQFNNNPPYDEMITAAILALKEKDGSSRQAIDKFIVNVYKNLSPSHGTLLTYQLKKMKNEGKLVINKHSYMLPGIEFVAESVGQVSVGSKRGRGRPKKVQANGGGGVVDLEAPPVSAGVIGDSGIVGNAVPFDPIGAVPNVVPIGEVDGGTVVKRRPGRPPKSQAAMAGGEPIVAAEPIVGAEPISVGRRPPKVNNGMVEAGNGGSILGKRGRGRPVKKLGVGSGLVGNAGGVKKGRGRPPKFRGAGMVIGQRPRGRPRKGIVYRPRGRPRKNVPVNGGGAASFPVDGMGDTGRPAKMAVRRNTRKLSGKPVGTPKKGVQNNGAQRRFIAVIDQDVCQKELVILPKQISSEIGEFIPSQVQLMLPTGKIINAHYNKSMQSITNLGKLIEECINTSGSLVLFSWKGGENILVHIFNYHGSEVEYIIPEHHALEFYCHQDKIEGIGWKFIFIADDALFHDGQLEIPAPYFNRFRKMIPPYVQYLLPDGKLFCGRYSKPDRKFFDLMDIVIYSNIKVDDVLMFTNWGSGQFEVVFNESRVEKNLNNNAVKTESNAEHLAENVQALVMDNNPPEYEIDDVPMVFSVVMTKSNVDNSSHGVYIPKNITPNGRQWKANEKVTLRTENGEWSVGLTISNKTPRFSAGWNQFTGKNRLKRKQTLLFTLLNDEFNGSIFEVQLH